jgi:hypothetical protein
MRKGCSRVGAYAHKDVRSFLLTDTSTFRRGDLKKSNFRLVLGGPLRGAVALLAPPAPALRAFLGIEGIQELLLAAGRADFCLRHKVQYY